MKNTSNTLELVANGMDFAVHYDPERGMYRVTIFEDSHYQFEFWFDEYEK